MLRHVGQRAPDQDPVHRGFGPHDRHVEEAPAADEVVQHVLRGVVALVPQEHGPGPCPPRGLAVGGVARAPGGGLEGRLVPRGAVPAALEAEDLQRHAGSLGPGPHEGRLAAAHGAHTVVHVHGAEPQPPPGRQGLQAEGQDHGVHASRERQHQRRGSRPRWQALPQEAVHGSADPVAQQLLQLPAGQKRPAMQPIQGWW
mmetsp:Transcript_55797/g.172790  ORF Transcript_55797/g.172790 Transcript_55797/m.172790 type:complete len:200 (-) Transcript_55797:161-760(-)